MENIFQNKKGVITTYALVFGAVFLILFGGLLSFILLQLKYSVQKVAWNEALEAAEAGINYYKWCLNNDVADECQTEKDYFGPDGNAIGKFSLQIDTTSHCGELVQKKIVSTGWTNDYPQVKRKIRVLYARTSVAKYSYIIDDNVWVGADHVIRGIYHSNGGVRMDGENQSLVSSAAPEGKWICTESFGCGPAGQASRGIGLGHCPDICDIDEDKNCVCPGVFTTENGNSDLFSFPVVSFDFPGITINLSQMKGMTSSGSGLYFGPSGAEGYRAVINEDSVSVWKVLTTTMIDDICTIAGSEIICDGGTCEPECSECQKNKCVVEDPIILTEESMGAYPISQSCGLIFFEDNLWIGKENEPSVIKGKVTIASANLIDANAKTDVWLQGNITYDSGGDSDGLTVIAQRNALIGLYSPNNMELRGIFVAQNGFFGRNHYPCSSYSPYCKRNELKVFGSIVSNGRVGTQWTSGSQISSGYLKRETYFDSNLIYNPPLFTPYISPDFQVLNWEEIK